jgi:hypothetical protein
METGRILAISTLRTLIVLHQNEEKRIRAVLADIPTFKVKMQARFDLERLVREKNAQVDELAKLEAGQL